MKTEQGIGTVAVVVIIAVLAIGGYTAVRVSQNASVDVDVNEEQIANDVANDVDPAMEAFVALRGDILAAVEGIQADLTAEADVALEASVATVAELQSDLSTFIETAEGDVRDEAVHLQEELTKVEVELATGVDAAATEIDAFIAEVEAHMDHEMMGEDVHGHDDDEEMHEEEGDDHDDAAPMEGESEVDVDAEAETSVDGNPGMDPVEGDVVVDGELSVN